MGRFCVGQNRHGIGQELIQFFETFLISRRPRFRNKRCAGRVGRRPQSPQPSRSYVFEYLTLPYLTSLRASARSRPDLTDSPTHRSWFTAPRLSPRRNTSLDLIPEHSGNRHPSVPDAKRALRRERQRPLPSRLCGRSKGARIVGKASAHPVVGIGRGLVTRPR